MSRESDVGNNGGVDDEGPHAGRTYWLAEDLGRPLPQDAHAISVCLPTWRDVIGYAEYEPRVRGVLRTGYPRFVAPPAVRALHARLDPANDGALALAFVDVAAAERAALRARDRGFGAAVDSLPGGAGAWVRFDCADGRAEGWVAWRTLGEGISGRMAEAWLAGAGGGIIGGAGAAVEDVRRDLAARYGVGGSHVFLAASGMAAVAAVHRALLAAAPGLPTVQVDFPYVDVPRLQKLFGEVVEVMAAGDGALDGVGRHLADGAFAGVFAEVPANPLLGSVDLPALAAITRGHGVPLVADDTVASVENVELVPHCDLVTCSLSKWASGGCNVLAGAVVVNPDGPRAAEWLRILNAVPPAPLPEPDARVLAGQLAGFSRRMREVNARADAVVRFLEAHPAVDRVWQPGDCANFAKVRRPGAGCGGLMSFSLRGGEAAAAAFYDAVALPKGPSLGADFTMLCPYTLLAHYDELDRVAGFGVPRDLIRLSVGREADEWICGRLGQALEATGG